MRPFQRTIILAAVLATASHADTLPSLIWTGDATVKNGGPGAYGQSTSNGMFAGGTCNTLAAGCMIFAADIGRPFTVTSGGSFVLSVSFSGEASAANCNMFSGCPLPSAFVTSTFTGYTFLGGDGLQLGPSVPFRSVTAETDSPQCVSPVFPVCTVFASLPPLDVSETIFLAPGPTSIDFAFISETTGSGVVSVAAGVSISLVPAPEPCQSAPLCVLFCSVVLARIIRREMCDA
jgi:hypothetical protein